MMSDRDPDTSQFTKEEYAYDAWGEHADNDNLPTVENNIRYIGARLECFVNAVKNARL